MAGRHIRSCSTAKSRMRNTGADICRAASIRRRAAVRRSPTLNLVESRAEVWSPGAAREILVGGALIRLPQARRAAGGNYIVFLFGLLGGGGGGAAESLHSLMEHPRDDRRRIGGGDRRAVETRRLCFFSQWKTETNCCLGWREGRSRSAALHRTFASRIGSRCRRAAVRSRMRQSV